MSPPLAPPPGLSGAMAYDPGRAEFVERLDVSPRGHVFIADRDGTPLVTPRAAGDPASLARPGRALMTRVVGDVARGDGHFEFLHRDVAYLGHIERMRVGNLKCIL